MVVYMDDILLMVETKEIVQEQAEPLVYLLQYLGFVINQKKSVLEPTQEIEFLGLTVDTAQIAAETAGRENKEDLCRSKENRERRASISQSSLSSDWENAGNIEGNPTSPPILPSLTNEINSNSVTELTELRLISHTLSGRKGRVRVVGVSHVSQWNGKTPI